MTYVEQQAIIRMTTYDARTSAQDILSYYQKNLEAGGWSMKSQEAHRIDFLYRTSDNRPPFDLSVIIDKETKTSTEFSVVVRINGPFAWRNWCSTLKP